MPKKVTEKEKEYTRKIILSKGLMLVREKGLRHVTVDDVVNSVGIGKGSFYSYYSSKEEMLYELIRNEEQRMIDVLLSYDFVSENFKNAVKMCMNDIYLSPDSIALYVTPSDLEYLIMKLPDKHNEWLDVKPKNNFALIAQQLGINTTDESFGIVAYLMDSLQYIASQKTDYGKNNREKALGIIVNAIAEFLYKLKTESIYEKNQ